MSLLSEAPADPSSALAPTAGGGDGAPLAAATPRVISIDPIGTLVARTLPAGLVYRDALLEASGLMLPRPDIFEAAHEAALAAAPPRFGAGRATPADWWRAVTRDTYARVLTSGEYPYDDDELAAYEACFDDLFDVLQRDKLISDELWTPTPDAPRLLAALRAWRDAGGPRVVAVTDGFDDRLGQLLANVLGGDVVAATFDGIVGGSGSSSAFEVAAEAHGQPPAACRHVAVAADPACQYETLLVDPSDYDPSRPDGLRASLLDLLDDWGLPRAEGDDVVVTSRTYSVYDPEYPGFDGEGPVEA